MRSLTICVDYAPFLSVTLPRNRHHFDQMYVVTSWADVTTQQLCDRLHIPCLRTNSFFERGADFNKYAALEEGLDWIGRFGWICLLDADILWPQKIENWSPQIGELHVPFRRMGPLTADGIPDESTWSKFPRWHITSDWSGYAQIFHCADPVLIDRPTPWHETNWRHAGGGDTMFQRLWPLEKRIRPDWECLHFGEPEKNWCGLGGQAQLKNYLHNRTGPAATRFDHEKL